MEFRKIAIKDLVPASYNPRKALKPGDKEYEKIKRSIQEFGYCEPIIVNSDMTIIGGHQRVTVLADLGYTDLFDLYQNVSAGVYMLKYLFNKYEGDTTFVLMAYNAGETGAANQRAAGIYETEYTVEILEQAEVFSSYIDNALNN